MSCCADREFFYQSQKTFSFTIIENWACFEVACPDQRPDTSLHSLYRLSCRTISSANTYTEVLK